MYRAFGWGLGLGLLAASGCSESRAPSKDVGTGTETDQTHDATSRDTQTGNSGNLSHTSQPSTPSHGGTVATGVPSTPNTVAPQPTTSAPQETGDSVPPVDTVAPVVTVTPVMTVAPIVTVTPQPTGPGSLGTYTCPDQAYASTPLDPGATLQAIAGVPPTDDFADEMDQLILEGPVWIDGNLYLSQINNGKPFFGPPFGAGASDSDAGAPDAGPRQPPPGRILKVAEAGEVSVALADTGSNGLGVDASGSLIATDHSAGSVVKLSLTQEPTVALVTVYDNVRFNSPNDLTFGLDGTLYFTDPDYQAPAPAPQGATRVYKVAPGTSTATPIIEDRRQPNGITFSPDRNTLYVSASDGVFAYPVSADGSLGAGTAFAPNVIRSSDGMAVDCAGNLYTTAGQTVTVVDATGQQLGSINVSGVQSVTNVAFGDADRQSLYITSLGTGARVGLFKVRLLVPGMPY
jgi:gluconolactonase